jgi:hypothetical protein
VALLIATQYAAEMTNATPRTKTPEQASAADMPESAHDVFVHAKIEAALRRKREGRATYKPLRDIAAKYDLDAPEIF